MDLDSDRVLKLIFPDGVPENLQDNPELYIYLSKIGTYRLDELKKEQIRLIEENKSLVEQTQDLAISNFKTFIQTSECNRSIFKEFQSAEKQVENLSGKFPDVTRKCEQFLEDAKGINNQRHVNNMTLKKNAELLEILELPQLMESCISEARFEEAIELASYVHKLDQNHSEISLISGIRQEVESKWQRMLMYFLSQLRTDLQLPKCLEMVGYLRRMQAFSENELRLIFLQARDAWLTEVLAEIPKDDAQQHITKTIEVTRINLFNIVTQYRAIFPEENILNKSDAEINLLDGVTCNGNRLFQSWLHRKIDNFLKTLEADLLLGMNSYDTVLGQCMYFGLSFSRVGSDFRALIAPIFIRVIKVNFEKTIKAVNQTFDKEIEKFTVSKPFGLGFHAQKTNFVASTTTATTEEKTEQDSVSPPESLLDFYPLANLCNGYLNALNELRLCAPIAIANDVTRLLQDSLQLTSKRIEKLYWFEQRAFSDNYKENFIKFASCFAYDLIPYIQFCIQLIFPPQKLTSHLGINLLTLESEGITYLERKKILQPLQDFLPDKVDVLLMQEKSKLSKTTTTTTTSDATKAANDVNEEKSKIESAIEN